ncbi:MAG: DNA repair protein RecN [bacterium]
MLKSIFIKDFTLIDELSLDFDAKLNILTGETGAGKSIIIDAIDAALGARANKDLIKEGKEKASIELTLQSKNNSVADFLQENGIDSSDELVLYREITPNATRSRVNGVMVTQNILQELKNLLIDIHSQHQTYTYLQPKTHINLLDEYGNDLHKETLEDYQITYRELLAAKREFAEKSQQNTDIDKQTDFLKFQIDEIKQAEITDIEEFETLKAEREKIVNANELKELTYSSYYTLYGQEASILSTLGNLENKLIKASNFDKELSKIADSIAESAEILKDASDELRNYSQNLSCDPYRLEQIEERLNLLDKLRRKYGSTLEEILESLENFEKELENIENAGENLKLLEEKIETLEKKSNLLANELSASRQKLAKELSEKIENELRQLAMPNAKFKVNAEIIEKNSLGIDNVEFLISANPGESLKPLAKIASGGEISRIMLAIKAIFAKSDSINTVIFDEIDTGISGPTLQAVADKMKLLSASHQIICITHQPIIAATADKHLHVEKYQDLISTKISVKELDWQGRIEILSHIAGGEINESTKTFAKELLGKNR